MAGGLLGAIFDSIELVFPITLECSGPFVKGANRFGVCPVQLLPALTTHPDQSNFAQDSKVLGDGGLSEAKSGNNVGDRPFVPGEKNQDTATGWFSDRVECI